MTRDEFGHWAAGVLAGSESYATKVGMLLVKAREVLQLPVPSAAAPPAMLPMRVGDFCCHNVRASEHCDACALAGADDGLRVYALVLPVDVRQVFVRRDAYVGTSGDSGRTARVPGSAAVGDKSG